MGDPIHVAIVRTVKPGCETAFEQALHDFVQRSLRQGGQMGVHILRPAPGSDSRQYGIIRKFADREALAAFRTSPEYLEWNLFVPDLTEGAASVEELCGLESWFTLPGRPLRPLPRWKMALLTWVAVWPVSMAVPAALGPFLAQRAPNFIFAGLVAAGIVVVLTWVAMPILNRLAKRWLYPQINSVPTP